MIEEIELDRVKEPRILMVEGDYHNKIRVEKGRIRFEILKNQTARIKYV